MKTILQYEPLIDYEDLNSEISEYLKQGNGWLTEFKKTQEFEEKLQDFLGIKHCILVNNGTISLTLALLALNIKPWDKVVVPALSMIATSNAVELIGATPIFVDVCESNLCMNPKILNEQIQWNNIRAIIYVSLNGRYDKEIQELSLNYDVPIIEDNAQSLGSKYNGNFIGNNNYNSIGSFSFSMPKIITTGQGGCLTTNDDVLAKRLRKLKDFGRISGGIDIHDEFGINCKFTEMQAITGLSQMKNLEWRIQRKKEIYKLYFDNLKYIEKIKFLETDLDITTPWFVDIYVDNREKLIKYLQKKHIGSRVIYPSITKQETYKGRNKFPVADKFGDLGLWLPSSLTLQDSDIINICKEIRDFYEK